MVTLEDFNNRGSGRLPGYLGIVITRIGVAEIVAELEIKDVLMAPNGYLHAGGALLRCVTAGTIAAPNQCARSSAG